jgi:phage tail-like protein
MLTEPSLQPPIPGPPHDPTWLLLDARTGWRQATAEGVEQRPEGTLSLARLPEAGRFTSERAGSLGGLVPPRGSAIADDAIFLLDPTGPWLRVFDPCECRFVTVPGIGGPGTGARQLGPSILAAGEPAAGIAVGGGSLYLCDPGNQRLSVFVLPGYGLRGHWKPPAGTTPTWTPVDAARDSRGRIFVADSAGGAVHRFDRSGRWLGRITGQGAIRRVVVDCFDRLYVVVDGDSRARVVDAKGAELDGAERPDAWFARFPHLPFAVDADGRVDMTRLCTESRLSPGCECAASAADADEPTRWLFDGHGQPIDEEPPAPQPMYHGSGQWIAGPLDSGIYRCQWHRVVLHGDLPRGTHVIVSTFTAETDQPPPTDAEELWETRQRTSGASNDWDCLVRSGGGRFLWLRLQLAGSGAITPCVDGIRVEFPRVSLRRYLPAVFGQEPVSADFTDRFLSIFDTTLRSIEKRVDRLASYFDARSAPAGGNGTPDFLGWLATWVGVALDRQWPEDRRRRWLQAAVRLYPLRGTREGLRRSVLVFLGLDLDRIDPDTLSPGPCARPTGRCDRCRQAASTWGPPMLILEHFRLRRWLFLGQGRLDDQAMLWGQRIVNRSQLDEGAQVGATQLVSIPDPLHDPFGVYAHRFTVFVPERCGASPGQRRALENLIQAEKPAHTRAGLEFVGPRFRIGRQSMVGYDTVIGRYLEGVTLDETALGSPALLGNAEGLPDNSTLVVGRQARIGAATRLA